ncbi:sugar ABC transporter substrate-binding protein [Subtercola endophyticus]|uniref:sugar ABC transporter substrate-binding protein n=1 Tax=Subtercola endophyticus TaxID=2895559 RepID=UPI001E2B1753|nr:substrate-binding domain-containing protein [Subtercola endophyticus]UFS58327.1 substrate-binding domain-containing protein [Subtercola endophyticus]
MKLHSKWLFVSAAVIAVMAVSGCSSGDDTTANAGSSAATGGNPNAAAAAAYVAQVEASPTGIGYNSPITGTAPTGINAAILENSTAVNQRTDQELEHALKDLGWNYTVVPIGNGAEDPATAFDQALDAKPDIVFYSGYSSAQFSAQLARAGQMGVKAVASCINDPATSVLIGVVCDPASRDLSAKATASYIAAHGTGSDHVQLYVSSTFPIDQAYGESFQKWMTQLCPGCEVTSNSFQISDIGTKLPGDVVSAVQRDPKTNYVIFCFGDAMTGVVPALDAVGLTSQVTLGGGIPGTEQYARLKAGDSDFWFQDNTPWISYRFADIAVRNLLGEDTGVVTNAPLVSQLLTKDNINTAVFSSDGYWLGYNGYNADYLKQWGLK